MSWLIIKDLIGSKDKLHITTGWLVPQDVLVLRKADAIWSTNQRSNKSMGQLKLNVEFHGTFFVMREKVRRENFRMRKWWKKFLEMEFLEMERDERNFSVRREENNNNNNNNNNK